MKNTWWVTKDDLIDEQADVIELPMDGSYLVTGPPGSGKTNLLLLRANYLTLAKRPNIAVIVFTRTLSEFIRAGASQYDFPPDRVHTCNSWMLSLLKDYGKIPKLPDDFEERRSALLNALIETIQERKLENLYDVVLLDEAQDYWPNEINIFRRLAKDLFVVADPKQKIYGGKNPVAGIEKFVDKAVCLKHHFRNGLRICRLADSIAKDRKGYEPMEPTSNYDEAKWPSRVDEHESLDLPKQIEKLLTKLDLQLKAYPGELVGICCPRKSQVAVVWEAIQDSKYASLSVLQQYKSHSYFDENTQICVSTCHATKGLEFRALHFAGADKLRGMPRRRNVAFTTVTRAKTSLDIYHDRELPAFFAGALAKLNPANELPNLGDLFGQGE